MWTEQTSKVSEIQILTTEEHFRGLATTRVSTEAFLKDRNTRNHNTLNLTKISRMTAALPEYVFPTMICVT